MAQSLILALHARYEAANAEYNLADKRQPPKPADGDHSNINLYFAAERGMRDNTRETTAIREAILYQVPDDDEEAMVLTYHLWSLYDPGDESVTEREGKAIEQGLNSLLDYMASERRLSTTVPGEGIARGVEMARSLRRFRTGQVEG